MLDERKAAILRAVVEEYIETAQPVGSGHVAAARGVQVSPATVRNDMAVLEQEGYLRQPHTSAGRVPTEKGYRFFVDSLTSPGQLPSGQAQQIKDFFAKAHGELERMLLDTSRLLSDLTQYGGVVTGPPAERASIRAVQLVGLAPRVAVVVAVLSNGTVDKHTIDLPDETGDERLAAATAHLNLQLVGRPLVDAHRVVSSTGDSSVDRVVRLALDVLTQEHDRDIDHVFVGGTARMAAAFDAVDTVRQVLGFLEQQYVVVSLLRDVLDRGLHVAIGTETGLVPLAECSLVVAPYLVEGEPAGNIAVLGPTRMNYPQALAAVAIVSRRLSASLSEG
jgi:heat-inducible transcriptional repressor